MKYAIETQADGDTVMAWATDIPWARTFGTDEAEAKARVVDAIETAIMGLMANRAEIPAPTTDKGGLVELPALSAMKIEIYRSMRADGVGKAELARRLGVALMQIDRLLDLGHASRLDAIERAFAALGRRLEISVEAA